MTNVIIFTVVTILWSLLIYTLSKPTRPLTHTTYLRKNSQCDVVKQNRTHQKRQKDGFERISDHNGES
jgi:hypothetical protein